MARAEQWSALVTITLVAVILPLFTAQPPTADISIGKDRAFRQSALRAGRRIAEKPKWGFFGTVFNLILEQINDTKSAYNQISDLVNNQFVDDNNYSMYSPCSGGLDHFKSPDDRCLRELCPMYKTVTMAPEPGSNGTTESPKITRSEFLGILDRNLKGLARLRNLEWREARKDSWTNLQTYWGELFGGKKSRS